MFTSTGLFKLRILIFRQKLF